MSKKYERDGIVIKVFKNCITVKHPQYKAKRYKKEKDTEQQINNLFYLWGDLERFKTPTTGRWAYI